MKKSKLFVLLLTLLFSIGLLAGCGKSGSIDEGNTEASGQKIKATLTVVYEDKTSKDFELTAKSEETLADAMYGAKLISQQDYNEGYVTEVDGIVADYNKEQAWWCLQDKDGKQLSVGIKDVKLKDGDTYKFVYTIGF